MGSQGQRILFLATVYTHLAAFHIPFLRLLQEEGFEVEAAAAEDGRKKDVEAAGIRCLEIPFSRSPYHPANFVAYRELRQLLQKRHYRLVHAHTPVAAFLARLAARKAGVPILYTAHGFHFYKGAPLVNWLLYYMAERLAARWTDGLIVMNGEDYENAKRLGFVPGENLFYVHGVGVDLKKFAFPSEQFGLIRKEQGLSINDIIVICVGELNENKNQGFLIDAWSKVVAKEKNAYLLLVGDGILRRALEKKVMKKRIPHVHFLGFRHDVPQLLHESNILALVSKREGLPRCIMEAMADGKPVVASNVRGNRDLVEHGRTGLLVELGDVTSLAAALERLIADHDLRATMGATGREKIQDYSLERVLSEMAAIYDRYLGAMP